MEAHGCNNRRSNILLLLLIVSVVANLFTPSAASSSSPIAIANEEKVELTLYYEALCPFCENFIVNSLYKLFDNGLISIVDLKLSPYGNAKIRSNGTIVCQHGTWECVLNTVEACAIHAWPAVSDYFPFVYCVENLTYEGEYANWESCFEKVNVDSKPVLDCYSSGFGHEVKRLYTWNKDQKLLTEPHIGPKLQKSAILRDQKYEIQALEPPHTYVPWVTLNGQPLYDDYYDVFYFICKAYKGSNTPQACLDYLSLPVNTRKDDGKTLNHVCYKEENEKSKSRVVEIISATKGSWMHDVGMAESM